MGFFHLLQQSFWSYYSHGRGFLFGEKTNRPHPMFPPGRKSPPSCQRTRTCSLPKQSIPLPLFTTGIRHKQCRDQMSLWKRLTCLSVVMKLFSDCFTCLGPISAIRPHIQGPGFLLCFFLFVWSRLHLSLKTLSYKKHMKYLIHTWLILVASWFTGSHLNTLWTWNEGRHSREWKKANFTGSC